MLRLVMMCPMFISKLITVPGMMLSLGLCLTFVCSDQAYEVPYLPS